MVKATYFMNCGLVRKQARIGLLESFFPGLLETVTKHGTTPRRQTCLIGRWHRNILMTLMKRLSVLVVLCSTLKRYD
jgi:hypothetical protein